MKSLGVVGIIAGTALRNLEGLKVKREFEHQTHYWKNVSVIEGELDGLPVFLVPRHGKHHERLPSEVNYIGNMIALKQLGVTQVLAVSAMGGLAPGYDPGMLVFVDATTDKTQGRRSTIFGEGIVAHVTREKAVCPVIHSALVAAAEKLGVPYRESGDLVVMNGPQFSSAPESRVNRLEGHQVVGMTNEPEAKLARELGLHYAVIGQVTDHDNPPPGTAVHAVTQQEITHRLASMGSLASSVIRSVLASPFFADQEPACGCHKSLVGAVLTHPKGIDTSVTLRLKKVFGLNEIPANWFAH